MAQFFFRCPEQEKDLTQKYGSIFYYMFMGRKVLFTECNSTGKLPSKEAKLLGSFLRGQRLAWVFM